MKYKAKYLITARQDREVIKIYLNQYSTKAAGRLFAKIKRNMEYVKNNPYIYEAYERRPEFRRMVVEDYLVFYRVNEKDKIIEVHHILHGMIDIENTV
ncbi:MAG: type II toxin-antitoxin system RelE/ParE family toxin [Oscillospiraceae bacterium]|nr:type II toxin-antitoxin system RelE/ParE family toxin [Oscillospiraceae bacterium]